MSAALPALVDCRGIMEETGMKRNVVEAIMRELPKVTIDGKRKVFVRRSDVARYLDERTAA